MGLVSILAISAVFAMENLVAASVGLNMRVTNAAWLTSAAFFFLAQSPRSVTGFALTVSDWGDKYRAGFRSDAGSTVSPRECRLAAHRSIMTLSLFVAVGLAGMMMREPASAETLRMDKSVLMGMCCGFWGAYLAVLMRRTAP